VHKAGGETLSSAVYAPRIASKVPLTRLWQPCEPHTDASRGGVSTHTTNQARMEDCIDIKVSSDDNTIAIKTAITDCSESGSRNANPKIRNSDYVTTLASHDREICFDEVRG